MNQSPASHAATDAFPPATICISFNKILFCHTKAHRHAVSRRTLSGVRSGRNYLSKYFYSRMTKHTSDKGVMCCVGDLHCYSLKK